MASTMAGAPGDGRAREVERAELLEDAELEHVVVGEAAAGKFERVELAERGVVFDHRVDEGGRRLRIGEADLGDVFGELSEVAVGLLEPLGA